MCRWIAVIAGAMCSIGLALAQTPYQPHPASPPKDAGYILADGTIQIVGWDEFLRYVLSRQGQEDAKETTSRSRRHSRRTS